MSIWFYYMGNWLKTGCQPPRNRTWVHHRLVPSPVWHPGFKDASAWAREARTEEIYRGSEGATTARRSHSVLPGPAICFEFMAVDYLELTQVFYFILEVLRGASNLRVIFRNYSEAGNLLLSAAAGAFFYKKPLVGKSYLWDACCVWLEFGWTRRVCTQDALNATLNSHIGTEG